MRRSDREITDRDKILQVIEECDVCRLAFNDNKTGYPYILPLNFGYETDESGCIILYFHGANQGYKYELMAQDPRVSFEMDCNHRLVFDNEKGNCTMEYQSVIGRGTIEYVEGREDKIRALTILTDNYHETHFEFNQAAVDRTTVLKLVVEQITAKQRYSKS